MTRAKYWHKEGDHIACDLCPHACRLPEGQTGRCRVRAVQKGEFVALGYGQVSSAHVDPIEKKPLYHFRPGSAIFSVGGWGCNLGCSFCQNWTISQRVEWNAHPCSPTEIAEAGGRPPSIGIAYTYNEPLINFEFVRDCAALARERGLANVLVTNGYIRPEPAAELLPLIDALNIDIKSMDEAFYRHQCRATLDPVLGFCRQAVSVGCHVEITNLVIPGLNDTESHFERLAQWIRDQLGPSIPLHLSAYHPEYRCEQPPTSVACLIRAREIARGYLAYIYIGNVWNAEGQNTECPQCSAVWVERRGYRVRIIGVREGRCAQCKRPVEMILGSRSALP